MDFPWAFTGCWKKKTGQRRIPCFACLIRRPAAVEAIAAFVQWADANPDQKTLGPEDGIAAYMMKQFPCDRSKRK